MRMIIFDDGRNTLEPLTDLRAAFEVRTGILTTVERIVRCRKESPAGVRVPDRLANLVAERSNLPVNEELAGDEEYVLVNGRWLNPATKSLWSGDFMSGLDLKRFSGGVVDEKTGDVVLAVVHGSIAAQFLESGLLPDSVQTQTTRDADMLVYPWDVIRFRDRAIETDARLIRIADAQVPDPQVVVFGEHPVEIDRTARIYPTAVLDAQHGPIIIDAGAVVRPGAILCGPCSVGRHSVIIDRAHIKANTVVGPVCKVGGEVGGTIFQGYSNKSHDGHLGDSWVGEWVNFGAGTTNSNLLNTYGEVKARIGSGGPRVPTGMTFLGAIVGDHVKFAINTRIITGSIIGTGAMIATTKPPPTFVPPFTWLTDVETTTYQWERFAETMRAVMSRRHVEASSEYESTIRRLLENRSNVAGDAAHRAP